MKMSTNFHKFSVNSRTIDIKLGGIGAIFMGLQPILFIPAEPPGYVVRIPSGVGRLLSDGESYPDYHNFLSNMKGLKYRFGFF